MTEDKRASLIALGEKLTKEGPHKIESTPRRVRDVLGGQYIFDTTSAVYVWEYLYFYIPKSSIFPLSLTEVFHPKPDSLFYIGKTNYGVSADGILGFSYPGPLNDLIRIPVASLEKWLAEDEVLQGTHPKDPYKRIETFPSSREIRIEYQGTTVITSSQNIFFYETMLRPRYYLNPGALLNDPDDPDVSLVESDTTTFCTYKGMAK